MSKYGANFVVIAKKTIKYKYGYIIKKGEKYNLSVYKGARKLYGENGVILHHYNGDEYTTCYHIFRTGELKDEKSRVCEG